MSTPTTLPRYLERPATPLVFFVGDHDHAVPLALARAAGVSLTKRALFAGRGHPVLQTCTPAGAGAPTLTLFDAGALWRQTLAMFFNDHFVVELLAAAERAPVLLLAPSASPVRTRALLRLAGHFGVAAGVVWAPSQAEADVLAAELARAVQLRCTPEIVVGPLGRAKASAQTAHQLVAALTAQTAEAPRAAPAVFVPREVTGYGVEPGVLRALRAAVPAPWPPGAQVDALTADRAYRVTIDSNHDGSPVFTLRGVAGRDVVALATPGAASASPDARVRLAAESTLANGRLYAFANALGPVDATERTLRRVPDPMQPLSRRAPLLLHAAGAPFVLGQHSRDEDIAVALGWFV